MASSLVYACLVCGTIFVPEDEVVRLRNDTVSQVGGEEQRVPEFRYAHATEAAQAEALGYAVTNTGKLSELTNEGS